MIRHLLTGISHVERFTDDDLRAGWDELGERLTREHIRHHPGSRPWGWWHFDAPERRRCTSGQHKFDDPARQAFIAKHGIIDDIYNLRFGVPACSLPQDDWHATYDTESEYLDRLDLLTPTERTTLTTKGH
jgi:hypothetical protein